MQDFITVITYPLQRIIALLFSLEVIDGLSVGSLIVSALLLGIIYKALVGNHLGGVHGAGRSKPSRNDSGGDSSGD